MKRYCFTLDLKNDVDLITAYRKHHENIWPEITSSIRESGIVDMEIYLLDTRLFMIMDVDDNFSFEKKLKMDTENPKVKEWEELMWKFQQSLPGSKPGEKWRLMERIFNLEEQPVL